MQICGIMIKTIAYPRAALIGNPSDGYFGKTIAFVFRNFSAEVELRESQELQIIPCNRERLQFIDVSDLVNEIAENGYYGGGRLVKATLKVFHDFCRKEQLQTENRNFTIRYSSSIPGRLGLAGSSAIVTATMKALMKFHNIEIPNPILANLVLSAEKDELKISAGLQDRVAQVYGCPVFMNFDKALMEKQGFGEYIPFDKNLLPHLYIAYRVNLSEGSEATHNNLAARFAKNETVVLEAMNQWADLAEQTFSMLQKGDKNIGALLNKNFDIRNNLIQVSSGNKELVMAARLVGASAKFTGSGGAIIGTYNDEKMFDDLAIQMKKIGAELLKPEIK